MDDTRVDDVHVKLRIVASLRQNHYASDWNGIAVHEKGLWTSVRRTVLGWWENKIAAMSHLQQLSEDANSILSRAIADHVANKKEPNFEERVKNPRSRVHKNANFIKNWATDMSEAIGTREQGMATQYVVYAGDIPTTSKLDGIMSKMCGGVECARTFFPEVPVPKTRVRCAVGGGAVFDDDEEESTPEKTKLSNTSNTSHTPHTAENTAAPLPSLTPLAPVAGSSSSSFAEQQQQFYGTFPYSYDMTGGAAATNPFLAQPPHQHQHQQHQQYFDGGAQGQQDQGYISAPIDIGAAGGGGAGGGGESALAMVQETPFGTPDDVNSVASQKQHDAL